MLEDHLELYVSVDGNDSWSGTMPNPNREATDGPLATVTKARDIVRELKRKADLPAAVKVWIRGGRYSLKESIVFDSQDSAPVTYEAFPGERPIFDGGTQITGWKEERIGDTLAWTVELPEVAKGKWYFKQLFVNGQRRTRARLPKQDYFWIDTVPGIDYSAHLFDGSNRFQCKPGDIQSWTNLTDADIVVLHYWIEERLPVVDFDEHTRVVTSSRKSIFALLDDFKPRYARYYVENVFEALTEPGDWYLERKSGKLYYIPMAGESMEETEIFAPRIHQFIRISGNPDEDRYVEFLKLKGLEFQHSDWVQPPGGGERWWWAEKGVDFGAAAQSAVNIPGVIYLEGARHCVIEDCRIRHVGWWGIELSHGCQYNRITANTVSDMGAGGIKLDGADIHGPIKRRTGYNKVTDNYVHHGGRVFHSAPGIISIHSFGNVIAHNHVHDFYNSGICCGFVWGYKDNISRDNLIENNYIHHLGFGLLSDMGGIYTLGIQPGTIIRGNVIHDITKHNYGGWGIYLDEGSSHITVEHNLTYRTDSHGYCQHYGRENIVRHNIFALGRDGTVSLGRAGDRNSFTFERNIVVMDDTPLYTLAKTMTFEPAHFVADVNLVWNLSGQPVFSGIVIEEGTLQPSYTLKDMQRMGYDRHSVEADPGFVDIRCDNYKLTEGSPAYALGIQAIDTSYVGPRNKK